jgi:Mg2+/citrate symporter
MEVNAMNGKRNTRIVAPFVALAILLLLSPSCGPSTNPNLFRSDYINMYAPLVAYSIGAIVSIISLVVYLRRQQKRRQESLKNNTAKRKPSSSKAYQKNNMPASISESQPEQKKSPSKNRLEQKLSGITICPKCKMKVFPKSDGTCPGCQSKISP